MPLTALIKEQAGKLTQAGFKAVIVSSISEAESAITDDNITHILLSPEILLTCFIPAAEKNIAKCNDITHLFIDESHCVVNW